MRVSLALWILLVGSGAGALGCNPGGDIMKPGLGCPSPALPVATVDFSTELAASPAMIPSLTLWLCHNTLCSTLHPVPSGAGFSCDFVGPLTATCSLDPTGSRLTLSVKLPPAMSCYQHVEKYSLRVLFPDATPPVNLERVLTYTVGTPDAGTDCPPVCQLS